MIYHKQYLKRTRTNCVIENHNASYRGLGQDGPGRLAPTLGGRLASQAHDLKESVFWEKYVMSLNLNTIVVIRIVIRCWHDIIITFFIITNIQRTMTGIVTETCYFKTEVNVKNVIIQRAYVSRRSAFETTIL